MPPPLPTFKTCSYWALLVSITPALQLYLHHYLSWQKLPSKSNKGRSKRPSSKPSDVKIWLPTFPLYRVSLKIVLLRSDEIFLAVQQNLDLRRFASNFEHFKGWQHSRLVRTLGLQDSLAFVDIMNASNLQRFHQVPDNHNRKLRFPR